MTMHDQLTAQLTTFEKELSDHEREVSRLKRLIKLTTNTLRELEKIEGMENHDSEHSLT